ncbi:hypothetical protein JR316_0007397 [Psilocybe cubensis]|uniref:Uncharacterized protein n=2 Tax=Psilocybe cubensis TaxID=181762 RepID=A0ACB8GZF0_PSICU|nr:hypothetical protein JR316_0007397 [Psilocybe cubensis]KAH9480797.1 hypothetical protein JR316_0007397 [Psilocybe cubensis]
MSHTCIFTQILVFWGSHAPSYSHCAAAVTSKHIDNFAMDQILHDLLKTNDPPSNDIIQLIRGILSEPRRQLEVVKADIQRLEEIQANLEATIHRYDPILSPVRRIPPDILSTIFMYCLPMDRNPDMRASECPMLLTRVCSAWRSLALSFPRLWTQIHIPYLHLSTIPPRFLWEDAPIQDDVDFGQSSAPASQLIETLRRRCEGVQEWLTRSGECALKISIYYHTQFSCNRDTYGWSKDSTTSIFLLAAIMPFASRFRELELDSPDNIYSIFETALSSCILTNLEKLKVSLKDPYIKYNNLSLPQNLFGDAPSLRCVSMNRLPDKNINSLRTNTSWRNLTSLSIFFGCTQHQVMILLERCPNLHRAHFRIVDDNASSFAEFANDVILPNLKYLWIIEERISNRPGDDMVYNGLYKYIHAPRLQYLQCRGSRELEPSAASLELFLKRSTQLAQIGWVQM